MFRSAVFKLTGFYFALLLFVCLTFSIPAYAIASQRIERGAENQTRLFRQYGNFAPDKDGDKAFDPQGQIRTHLGSQIEDDRHELLQAIILTNIAILACGTILCYLFAKRTLKPIEDLHHAQTRFTADASHELRTPLTVMKTEIDVALKQHLTAPELRDVLSSNLEEIERLSALSDQLLLLTKIDTPHEEEKEFDLSELVSHEVESVETKHSLTIEQDIEPGIVLLGMAPLCSELVRILISNAIDYSKDSQPEVTVTLSRTEEDSIELSVRDHGVGISDKDLPHIFERFYRGSEALSLRRSGHGLGLSLAQEIVTKHHGRISATSVEGQYSEFHVTF